jgi:hypothetical protein
VRVSEDRSDEDQVLLADGRGQVDAEFVADANEVALLSAVGIDGVVGVLEASVEGGDGLACSSPICWLWTTETERSICVSIG